MLPAAVLVVVVTANVFAPMPPRAARADLATATHGAASVVVAQEMARRDAPAMAPGGWRGYQPARPACSELAVYWRTDRFRVRRTWARVLSRNPSIRHGTRCAAVALLEHRRTGLTLPVVSVHLIPAVERNGRPRPLPGRVRTYHRAVDELAALHARLRARWGFALLGGDWNVDARADRRVRARPFPYRHLSRPMDSAWGTWPSLGHRHVDGWWYTAGAGLRKVHTRTVRATRSDHGFVRLRVSVGGR